MFLIELQKSANSVVSAIVFKKITSETDCSGLRRSGFIIFNWKYAH